MGETRQPPMRVALMWTLQTQFAGYVLARQRHLPELELLPREAGRSPIQEVLEGRADYGVAAPIHLLSAGEAARDLALVALFMTRSPVRLAGLRDRVGDRLVPREGLRVGVWSGEDTELRAMLRAVGTDLDTVEFVPVLDEVRALLDGEVDYVQSTTYNELPAIAAAAGGADRVVAHDPGDWGVDVAKDGLVVHRDLLTLRPAQVERVVRAVTDGWRRTCADPAAASEEVCRLVPGLDAVAQRAQLERLVELFDPAHPLGEPRALEIERAIHCASAAGYEDRDGAALQIDSGPWERARESALDG